MRDRADKCILRGMDMSGHKAATVRIDADAPAGAVVAEIATIGNVDRDGDYTEPGFFGKQITRLMWNHSSLFDFDSRALARPLGKGIVSDEGLGIGDPVLFAGQFNLEMKDAQEAYKAVKFDLANPPAIQEWSYGYVLRPGGWKYGNVSDYGEVRILQPLPDGTPGAIITEVSPVATLGAGMNTRTVGVKSADDGMRFDEHTEMVHAAIAVYLERAKSLVDLRARDGRTLAEEKTGRMKTLAADLQEAGRELERMLLTPVEPDESGKALMEEFLRYQQIEARLHGVL